MKSDQVRSEEAIEQPLAPRQQPEDLRGGKGDVEEEADPSVGDPLAQHPRDEHELVVVDPDEITGLMA
jgi:hypothetical protein